MTQDPFKAFWHRCPRELVADLRELDALIRKNAPKLAPVTQGAMLAYGAFQYRYATGREGTSARIAIAGRKSGISLYFNSVNEQGYIAEQFASRFAKGKVGKSCIVFKRLSDLSEKDLVMLIKLASRTKGAGETTTTKTASPAKAAKATKPSARATKSLSGGNPQIAKADGDAPVQAYIAALPGWKRNTAQRLDALIVRAAPKVQKAVKWNSPFYGIEARGWFLSLHAFTHYLKVAFFRGTSLKPNPPGPSTSKDVRYIDIREDDTIDEAQLTKWVKQACALPGWSP
jgi:hypothetical protein